MPPKRPVPLSDAALGQKAGAAAFGETNAGAPLPVKNTFIDVPSGSSPSNSKSASGLSTAPPQMMDPGFMRTVLESVNESASSGVGDLQGWKPPAAVQRPPPSSGGAVPDLPLMTPSPTGSCMFSSARYQLFGGPAPVQEATYSAFPGDPGRQVGPPVVSLPPPAGKPLLSVPPPQGSPVLSSQPAQGMSAPVIHSTLPPGASDAAAAAAAATLVPSATAATIRNPVRPVPAAKGKDAASDDEDADSEAERQQELLRAAGRTPENAPKPPPGAKHPSLGSAGHEEATCKRCCFFPRNRCLNGYECEFCHYEHEKRKRKNKKSKKKKGTDQGEEGVGEQLHGGPSQGHAALSGDVTLTYQWSDGMPGQVPLPPPMPGYAEWLAALPPPQHRAEPALATHAPPPPTQPHYMPPQPPPPYYDPHRAAYPPPQQPLGYPPYPGHHVPGLEPAWPYYGADATAPASWQAHQPPSYGGRMSYPPPTTAPAPEAVAAAAAAAADAADPTPPPPMCSPKLPKDIMESLQEPAPLMEAGESANG